MKRVLVIGGKGYIGSVLCGHFEAVGCTVQSWDTCWFGDHTAVDNVRADYDSIAADQLGAWDAVVLAAGHSGVAMCADREAAYANNVESFSRLMDRLGDQRLVFMSTSALYNGVDAEAGEDSPLPPPESCYEQTMRAREICAGRAAKDSYGLRLGTVCGASPNMRSDLMLNKMYLDARERGVVEVANPERWRPILAMTDLCRAVQRVVEWPQARPGIYNVASFNATIGDLAAETARRLHAAVLPLPPSPGYDMRICTEAFRRTFDFAFEGTVQSILDDLAAASPTRVATRHGAAGAVHTES